MARPKLHRLRPHHRFLHGCHHKWLGLPYVRRHQGPDVFMVGFGSKLSTGLRASAAVIVNIQQLRESRQRGGSGRPDAMEALLGKLMVKRYSRLSGFSRYARRRRRVYGTIRLLNKPSGLLDVFYLETGVYEPIA